MGDMWKSTHEYFEEKAQIKKVNDWWESLNKYKRNNIYNKYIGDKN